MRWAYADPWRQYRSFVLLALATLGLLGVPLLAMQFTTAVQWTVGDFVAMGLLLFSSGALFLLVAQRLPARRRVRLAGVFALAFLYAWAELAVGLFTGLGS